MNEESKNIETCLAENILAEVASVPTDPQFRSLVNESLDPLKQQALQQAGYADYEKFAWPHQPYTFTSQVKQMKSNLILLLRRLWRFPFGRGTIRSLADMWQHYITRLQGNETYGIPSRLAQLSDLPSAPSLLSDRKISGADVPDGMSLAQLLCSTSAVSAVTEIKDDNLDWIYNRDNFLQTLASVFPNMTRIEMHCSALNGRFWTLDTVTQNRALDIIVYGCKSIRMPAANQALFQSSYGSVGFPNIRLWIYGLEDGANIVNHTRGLVCGEFYIPDYKRGRFTLGTSASYGLYAALTKIYAGCQGDKTDTAILGTSSNSTVVDFEIGDGACQSISFTGFSSLTAENMYNHILLRLKQDEPLCGSGVTITLGTTNIEKLEAVEECNTKLTELEDTYGYTFA